MGYRELFDASIQNPQGFWADAAKAVTWTTEPHQVLDDRNPPFYRWFPDGQLNTRTHSTATSPTAGASSRR